MADEKSEKLTATLKIIQLHATEQIKVRQTQAYMLQGIQQAMMSRGLNDNYWEPREIWNMRCEMQWLVQESCWKDG